MGTRDARVDAYIAKVGRFRQADTYSSKRAEDDRARLPLVPSSEEVYTCLFALGPN